MIILQLFLLTLSLSSLEPMYFFYVCQFLKCDENYRVASLFVAFTTRHYEHERDPDESYFHVVIINTFDFFFSVGIFSYILWL